MTGRLDPNTRALIGGSATALAAAVLLKTAPSAAGLFVTAVAVALWARRARPGVAAAVAGVAWLCVTGFDVNHDGVLVISTWRDPARLAVLLAVAFAAAAVGQRRQRRGVRWPSVADGRSGGLAPQGGSAGASGPTEGAGIERGTEPR